MRHRRPIARPLVAAESKTEFARWCLCADARSTAIKFAQSVHGTSWRAWRRKLGQSKHAEVYDQDDIGRQTDFRAHDSPTRLKETSNGCCNQGWTANYSVRRRNRAWSLYRLGMLLALLEVHGWEQCQQLHHTGNCLRSCLAFHFWEVRTRSQSSALQRAAFL